MITPPASLDSSEKENFRFSDLSDIDVNSDAEELQMLQKLRLNGNEVIDKEKEMQTRITQYERKIHELQEELNSKGSSDSLQNISGNIISNKHEKQQKANNFDSLSTTSYNSEKLELMVNTTSLFGESSAEKKVNSSSSSFKYTEKCSPLDRNAKSSVDIKNLLTPNDFNNNINLTSNTKGGGKSKHAEFIRELEQYVNGKFSKADSLMNSLYNNNYDNKERDFLLGTINDNEEISELKIQNEKLKAQINEMKNSVMVYIEKHNMAKKRREQQRSQYEKEIAKLQEREKNLYRFIQLHFKQFQNPNENLNDGTIRQMIVRASTKLGSIDE